MKIIVKAYNSNIELFGEENRLTIYIGDINTIYCDKDIYDSEEEAIASAEQDYKEALVEAFPEHSAEEIEDALLSVMCHVSGKINW